MAVSFSVTGSNNLGAVRLVHGTFTSSSGDTSATLNNTVHGLGQVIMYQVSLDSGGINVAAPKVTQTGSSLALAWDDTLGYSGKWAVIGKSGV